jgi:gliding motility-associated-like protein
MKLKCTLAFLVLIFCCTHIAGAQGENNNWIFGNNCGLNFNTNPPTFFQNNIDVYESSTAVSGASGGLLFYTSGATVYDKNGNTMPNGTGLLGNEASGSSRQGVVIVKNPQNFNQYYIFTSTAQELYPNIHLYYSIVDLSLNNGLGAVTAVKNIILAAGILEPLMVMKHAECNSFWLLSSAQGSPMEIRAYAITSSGLNTTPVVTTLPPNAGVPSGSAKNDSLLICTGIGGLSVFSFNKATGQISNQQQITAPYTFEGSVFSANESKLYGIVYAGAIRQFDFSLWPNVAAVSASGVNVYVGGLSFWSVRLAPDNKIYLKAMGINNALHVINNPTASGAACNLVLNAVPLPATTATFVELGNPYVAPQALPVVSTAVHDSAYCFNGSAWVMADTSGISNYEWSTGAATTGIMVSQQGTYWVRRFWGCNMYVDTFHVTFDTVKAVAYHTDTTICFHTAATLHPSGNYDQYQWSQGGTTPAITVVQDGLYIRTATTHCDLRYDSVTVHFVNYDAALPRDTFLCAGGTALLNASVQGGTYLWQDGSTSNQYLATDTGLYTLHVSAQGCDHDDSVYVHYYGEPLLQFSTGDTAICSEVPLHLEAIVNGPGTYVWNTGATGASIEAAKAGTYTVTYTGPCATLTDSVHLTEFMCACVPFVPNAFSPNGDGKNDVFMPELTCPVTGYELRIYNRYGTLVFKSNDTRQGWDGRYKNALADVGVYFYYLSYKSFNGEGYNKKGDLILLR